MRQYFLMIFFSEVGANNNNYNDYINTFKSCNSNSNDILFKEFSETEVHETSLILKNNKSPGFNMITSELLKINCSCYYIKPALTHLIDLNFEIGIFPKNNP